jgi:hypothetical protein
MGVVVTVDIRGAELSTAVLRAIRPPERVDTMMAFHADLANPHTLWATAQCVFDQGQGASS